MLTKTSIQAVQALALLSGLPAGKYEGAVSIAKRTGAPRNYLGKLLRQLSTRGLVTSQKGLGGGFRLARDPKRISLYDVVEPIENINRWVGCVLGQVNCADKENCQLHAKWKNVRNGYLQFLFSTKISDVAARPFVTAKRAPAPAERSAQRRR
ncbi:MAG: Rrf2 family transcriptional regulator [Elusimicrobia bacterium]|nr:Rrf2 family transcriptional regulator [Elusimicrobiota bacterium]